MKPVNQEPIRVVAHLRGGKLIKGQLSLPALKDLDALKQQPTRLPDKVPVQPEGSPDTVEIGVDSLKALFFVKKYEGRTDYKEFKYFNFTPKWKAYGFVSLFMTMSAQKG